MADELNIVVKEDGTQQVVRDFQALASASSATAKSIDSLQGSLRGLDRTTNSLTKLKSFASEASGIISQMDALAVATDKISAAQARLIRTHSAALLSQERVRTQQQKTQVELAKVEYWLQRASDAEDKAAVSSQKLAAAQMRASTEAQKFVTAQQQTQRAVAQTAAANNQAATAAAQAATAQQRFATEQARTTGATANAAAAATRAAVAEENLANAHARAQTAVLGTATAQQRLEAATNAASTSAANLTSAQNRAEASTLRLQGAQARAAGSAGNYSAQVDALRAKLYPLEVAEEKLNRELERAQVLYQQGAISAKMYADAVRYTNLSVRELHNPMDQTLTRFDKLQAGSRLTRHELVNLGYQVQDIGVSLASGQKPLTVFIQQGAQIAGIASAAGVSMKTMGIEILKLVGRFWKPIAGITALVGGLMTLQKTLTETGGIKEYVNTLGLTTKELKKLETQSVSFMDITKGVLYTVRDLWKGLLKQLEEDFGAVSFFDNIWDKVATAADDAWSKVTQYSTAANAKMYATVVATYKTIVAIWNNWPAVFADVWTSAVNGAIGGVEQFINDMIDGVNSVLELGNSLAHTFGRGVRFELFDNVNLERQVNEHEGAAAAILSGYEKTYQDAYKDGFEFTNKLGGLLEKNIIQATKNRLQKEAKDLIDKRTGSDKASKELEKLENALARVRGEVSPSDQALRKIAEANDILTKSVAKGLITQAEADKVLQRLKERYEDQLDPIGKLVRETKQQINLLNDLPPAMEINAQMLRIENDLKAKNVQLTSQQRQQLMGLLADQQKEQELANARNGIYNQTIGLQRQYNVEQEATRQAYERGMIGMEQYTIRMNNLAVAAARLRIEMGTPIDGDAMLASMGQLLEGYNGVLSGLTSAFGDLFVTISDGFADSIGRAIVYGDNLGDSLRNVAQSAVSELISAFVKLGIQYMVNAAMQNTALATTTAASTAAAATTTAAWAPAAAVTSVASFGGAATIGIAALLAAMALSKGFKSGGYTGGKGQGDVAGVVHGQEFVMNAASTRRIGVGNLQALQEGRASVSTGTGSQFSASQMGGNMYVNVINNASNSEVTTEETQDSEGNVSLTVLINNVEAALAGRMASGQGKLHGATAKAFNLKAMPSGR